MPELINFRVCDHQISTSAKSYPNCCDEISLKEKITEKIDTTGLKKKSAKLIRTIKYVWVIGVSILIALGLMVFVRLILNSIRILQIKPSDSFLVFIFYQLMVV